MKFFFTINRYLQKTQSPQITPCQPSAIAYSVYRVDEKNARILNMKYFLIP
jgi:hypothetical protein